VEKEPLITEQPIYDTNLSSDKHPGNTGTETTAAETSLLISGSQRSVAGKLPFSTLRQKQLWTSIL
jgi:hypothetical protein